MSDEQNTVNQVEERQTVFSNGGFVIALMVVALMVLIVTWCVSFTAMFFGAMGALLSMVTKAFVSTTEPGFKPVCSCAKTVPFDERMAYLLVRAGLGMIFGTAGYVLAFTTLLGAVSGSVVIVMALAFGFVFDRIFFKA
ncbi:hypothetical protein [Basilea psittacipulmonis]|uniref:Uncharacterized protein n=1 Tax=Basilea psittacipulmonis DSM 24701 TaxID=1072685 RepID=A0A077DEB9_9BURK|nr:hypothetical protein [Basilea psittacipulmonis]AIL32516.1 hypothetical protein IX83_03630 [Basilea psittacipulmonis DSM 24701]